MVTKNCCFETNKSMFGSESACDHPHSPLPPRDCDHLIFLKAEQFTRYSPPQSGRSWSSGFAGIWCSEQPKYTTVYCGHRVWWIFVMVPCVNFGWFRVMSRCIRDLPTIDENVSFSNQWHHHGNVIGISPESEWATLRCHQPWLAGKSFYKYL